MGNWQEMVYDSVDSIKNRERSLGQWAQS